eukprot:5795935-Ditylum_brightwellii.AAC.5
MIAPSCLTSISLSDPAIANIMMTPAIRMTPGLTIREATIFFLSLTLMDMMKETLVKLGKEGINEA